MALQNLKVYDITSFECILVAPSVDCGGIRALRNIMSVISDYSESQYFNSLCRVFDIVNYYYRFEPNCSNGLEPLAADCASSARLR